MSWFPVDDAFHSHPKAQKAGDEALGMWTRAGSHCMAYLTDGFVAEWWVKQQPKGMVKARRLVAADLWIAGTNAGEQGFWFHDWKPECTKAHVMDMREKARQRKARSRESQQESRVTDSVTNGVSPASCLVPTQPNPTQPKKEPLVTSSTELTLNSPANPIRGTRLPNQWMPDSAVVAQMRDDHPHIDLKSEHAKFVDYWQSKPGKDARKTDWNATWRNWIRRAAENLPRNGLAVNGVGKPTQKAMGYQAAAERLIAGMEADD